MPIRIPHSRCSFPNASVDLAVTEGWGAFPRYPPVTIDLATNTAWSLEGGRHQLYKAILFRGHLHGYWSSHIFSYLKNHCIPKQQSDSAHLC